MTQEELNKLKVGEKAVDIQEYYWGPNGKILAYKATIYTCVKYLLFFKKIQEYTFPFYFESKEFALEFLKEYENYNFVKFYNRLKIESKIIKSPKHKYVMISSYDNPYRPCSKYDVLKIGSLWKGLVYKIDRDDECWKDEYDKYSCMHYSYIEKIEQMAAKEGTIGKTYSFKMIEENGK